MISAFITSAWGWFAKLPRGFHIAIGAVILCLALFTLHRCSVNDAVKADRKAQEAQVTEKALSAERAANSAAAIRQAEIQANDDANRKAIDDAVSAHPESVRAPAGAATNAVARELRARSSGDSASTR